MKHLIFALLLLLSSKITAQIIARPPDVSTMRTMIGSSAMISVMLGGNGAINDGSGDLFYWDDNSTATDNGITVIQATGIATGRWLRLKTQTVKAGSYTTSGITLQTSYVVTHSLGVVPGIVIVSPTSLNAAALSYISAKTATTFTITFVTIPVVGTNNLSFDWLVRL